MHLLTEAQLDDLAAARMPLQTAANGALADRGAQLVGGDLKAGAAIASAGWPRGV